MERNTGETNRGTEKKYIKLEDGSSVEAPEGVRDLNDYKEYLAEQDAREKETATAAEELKIAQAEKSERDASRAKAVKLAVQIENSIDESVVKRCLESGDYNPIFHALAGVDSIPAKGDQLKIEQDRHKLQEIRARFDESIEEATVILRNEYNIQEAGTEAKDLAAAVKLACKIENSVDEAVVKRCLESGDNETVLLALAGVDGIPQKGDQLKIDQNGRKLQETHDRYDGLIVKAMEILRKEYFDKSPAENVTEETDTKDEKPVDTADTVPVQPTPIREESESLNDRNAKIIEIQNNADKMMRDDLANGGVLNRLWKGSLFKGYYANKYMTEAYEQYRAEFRKKSSRQ